jgi:hypothetical protein
VKKKTFSRGLIWNRKNFNTEIHVFAPMKFSGSVKIQIQVNTEIIKWLCDVLTFLTDCYKRWLSTHLRSSDPCRIKSYWLPAKKLGVPLVHVSIFCKKIVSPKHKWWVQDLQMSCKLSQTCIKRSPLGQRKSGLIRQVTF